MKKNYILKILLFVSSLYKATGLLLLEIKALTDPAKEGSPYINKDDSRPRLYSENFYKSWVVR